MGKLIYILPPRVYDELEKSGVVPENFVRHEYKPEASPFPLEIIGDVVIGDKGLNALRYETWNYPLRIRIWYWVKAIFKNPYKAKL